jgi:hypothetical protein
MSACCQEIVVKIENEEVPSRITDLLGIYRYVFEEKRIADIEKGYFVYKHKNSNGYIYKTKNASWSVRR